MYKGFNMYFDWEDKDCYNKGLKIFEEHSLEVKSALNYFINQDGTIDGSMLQQEWFPQIDADVFLSHSHNDEEKAITLAGWIDDRLGLKTFVDSCIWGYSNTLLKNLDDKYSLLKENSYSYVKSNRAAGHVHMMLSTALTMMIDNAECFIFLNTPNSVNLSDDIELTQSPWIYSEITTSKYIRETLRRKSLILEKAEKDKIFAKIGAPPPFKVEYKLDLNHLKYVNWHSIRKEWASGARQIPKKHGLDILYSLTA